MGARGLPTLDHAALSGPVRVALGGENLDIIDWQVLSIHRPVGVGTGGVYRVSGSSRDRSRSVNWSLILKVVQAAESSVTGSNESPTSAGYWRRELMMYRSGLLDRISGVRAPRCYGIVESERAAWLWLEDVADANGSRWPMERFGTVAHRLGEFNGASAAQVALSADEFLSRGWLRASIAPMAPAWERLPALRSSPWLQSCWPGNLPEHLARLISEREQLLDTLDRLPQTICHLDAFPRNVLVQGTAGSEDVIAIDWAFAGYAPIGAELAPLIAAPAMFFDAEPEQMEEITRIALASYIAGLQSVGWHGDTRIVRFACAASTALRYGLVPFGIIFDDETVRKRFEVFLGRPIDDILVRYEQVSHFLVAQADEARSLLPFAVSQLDATP